MGALVLGCGSLQAGDNGLVWSYPSDGSWIAEAVSVGNEGTQVFTEFGAYVNSAMMLSAHDVHPPSPVWADQVTLLNMHRMVASSRENDVHVALHQRTLSGGSLRRAVVRKYRSVSTGDDWTREVPVDIPNHPYSKVAVSWDGQRIVVVVHDAAVGKTRVELLGPHSGTPLAVHELATGIPFQSMALSPDGRKLMLTSQMWVKIVDVVSGTTELSKNLFSAPDYGAISLSDDGQIAAFGTLGQIWLFERGATGAYQQLESLMLPAGRAAQRLAISKSGTTLAVGLFYSVLPSRAHLRAYDLPTRALRMERVLEGSGDLPNQVSQLAISADGARFAVGLWGDQAGLVPEVLVFERDTNDPIFAYDLPGSVNALDLSPGGDYLAVASKGVHANVAGGGGSFWLFRTGSNDLRIEGVPSVGSQVDVAHDVNPGAMTRLLVAPELAAQPTSFGRTGILYLARSSMSFLGGGVPAGPDGVARHPITVPNDSGLIGTSLYFQGLDAGPRILSASWVKMTLLP